MTTQPDGAGVTVIKLGGSTLGAHDTSVRDIAEAHASGTPIVIVHGGGAAVSEALAASGVAARFVRGLRVTDAATLDVVVEVLGRRVNGQIVAELRALGAKAAGTDDLEGRWALAAQRYDDDLGYVGRITAVRTGPLRRCLADGALPVIAPIAVEGASGQLLNTNADTAAGEVAAALEADRLVFLTDVPAVRGADGRDLARLTAAEARALIASGAAAGGMVPKLEAAIRAAAAGCLTRIIDGTQPGSLRRALAGEPIGTAIADG